MPDPRWNARTPRRGTSAPAALGPILLTLLVACPSGRLPPAPARPPAQGTGAESHGTDGRRAPGRAPALARLARPDALAPATLAEHAGELARRVDRDAIADAPALGDPGAPIVDRERGPRRTRFAEIDDLVIEHEPGEVPAGERIPAHDRLLQTRPTAKLDDAGRVEVRFETTQPVAGAGVYFGTTAAEDPFGLARLRGNSLDHEASDDGRAHVLRFEIGPLLGAKYDVAGARRTGRSEIVWRVELLDSETRSARVFDGRTPYRCEPPPCSEQSSFVQLPAIEHGPMVDRVRPKAAVISWDTDVPTAGWVIVVDEDGGIESVESAAPGMRHEVAIGGLEPARRYRYYAVAVDTRGEWAASRGATFETAPGPQRGRFSFVALSDSRSGHGSADEQYAGTNRRILRQLLFGALRYDPKLVVFVGDLVDGYTTEPGAFRYELQAWQKSVQPIGAYVPIYETMGNHESLLEVWETGWAVDRDGDESAEALFAERFVNPDNGPKTARDGAPPYTENVYSFDWGNAHMAVINSNYWFRSHPHRKDHPRYGKGQREGWVDDAQLEWLDADLAEARRRGADHLFVFTHEPAFPNGGHLHDGMYYNGRFPEVLERRAKLIRLLGKHGVAVLFHGDEHNYSRTRIDEELVEGLEQPLWQIISGGAGAPFYAQVQDAPWAHKVEAFDARQHFVVFHVDGERLEVEAVSATGERIDQFEP